MLGDGLTAVSIPEGGKVEITEAGNGSFSVENVGQTEIVVTIGSVETTIGSSDPPFDGWVSSSAQLEQVLLDLDVLADAAGDTARDELLDVIENVDEALAELETTEREDAAAAPERAAADLEVL